MIAGFSYSKGRQVWIDTEADSQRVFSSNPNTSVRIPESEGCIEDIFVGDKCLIVKTSLKDIKLKVTEEEPYLEIIND